MTINYYEITWRDKKPAIGLKTQQRLLITDKNKDKFTDIFDYMVKSGKTEDLHSVDQHWNWLKITIKSAFKKNCRVNTNEKSKALVFNGNSETH